MTYDDGMISFYRVSKASNPGEIPIKGLVYCKSLYMNLEQLGYNRYYTALNNDQKIEKVISTYLDESITTDHIAVDENNDQFIIRLIQTGTDEDGIRIMKLSLERCGENYAIIEQS